MTRPSRLFVCRVIGARYLWRVCYFQSGVQEKGHSIPMRVESFRSGFIANRNLAARAVFCVIGFVRLQDLLSATIDAVVLVIVSSCFARGSR
jgi:hypothetical protein